MKKTRKMQKGHQRTAVLGARCVMDDMTWMKVKPSMA